LTEEPVFFAWKNRDNGDPAPDDLTFLYLTDWYRDFVLEMNEWARNGVWSRNVMNNTTQTTDAFAQGSSASVFWNDVVYTAGKNLENNGAGKAGYYDLSPDFQVRPASYSGDCWAIASSSKNQGRAALVVDLMKTNAHSFECGVFGNQTEEKLAEFRTKLERAGVGRLTGQYRSQYAAFLSRQ